MTVCKEKVQLVRAAQRRQWGQYSGLENTEYLVLEVLEAFGKVQRLKASEGSSQSQIDFSPAAAEISKNKSYAGESATDRSGFESSKVKMPQPGLVGQDLASTASDRFLSGETRLAMARSICCLISAEKCARLIWNFDRATTRSTGRNEL